MQGRPGDMLAALTRLRVADIPLFAWSFWPAAGSVADSARAATTGAAQTAVWLTAAKCDALTSCQRRSV